MFLERDKYEEIKEVITDIFSDYDICQFPIDVFCLARRMQIKVIKYSSYLPEEQDVLNFASEDGMSFYRPQEKQYYIVYKDNENTGRIRFTIAHEIGHIVLEHTESNVETEREANFFAGQLLVPEGILVKKKITDPDDIVEMFDVSVDCACVAKNELGRRLRIWGWQIFPAETTLLQQFGLLEED